MDGLQGIGHQNEAQTQQGEATKKIERYWLLRPKAQSTETAKEDKSNNSKLSYLLDVSRVQAHFASLPSLPKVVVFP